MLTRRTLLQALASLPLCGWIQPKPATTTLPTPCVIHGIRLIAEWEHPDSYKSYVWEFTDSELTDCRVEETSIDLRIERRIS